MKLRTLGIAACGVLSVGLVACGGGGGDSSTSSVTSSSGATAQYGTVPITVSDASADDWAVVGVNVLSIALVPQAGGANVNVYTAPSGGTALNLEQLDTLADILASASVPTGTYTGAVVTVAANPGDVQLTAAAEPEVGFALAAGTVVPSNEIQIQNTQGSAPNLTVPIDVSFVAPITVATGSNNPIDIEFDLSHPAFIIGHQPPAAGTLLWAVDFKGPVRHRPVYDITRLVLRHMYGDVNAVAADGSSLTILKAYPTLPIVTPETEVTSTTQLTINVDPSIGTLYYDVDAGTSSTITAFPATLSGEYVRIAARYEVDGTLTATRVWASKSFDSVWLSPEGHVLHVNPSTNIVTVTNEEGLPVQLQVNDSTLFYFRQPWSASDDATAIGQGTAFLAAGNLVRGFKIHASVMDPLAAQWVAQSIDIETANYSGAISLTNMNSFTYTHDFVTTSDDYTHALDYISSSSANGSTSINGVTTPISGFKYWNFAFPTLVTSGVPTSINDFIAATDGTVSFGGNARAITPVGVTGARWNDPANPTTWTAPWAILEPVQLQLATLSVPVAMTSGSTTAFTFSISVATGTQAVVVDGSSAAGQATLVYQVDRSNNIVTVSPIDLTTASGMSTFTTAMTAGTPVRVYGIPQQDGTLMGYVITYFTGTMPMD